SVPRSSGASTSMRRTRIRSRCALRRSRGDDDAETNSARPHLSAAGGHGTRSFDDGHVACVRGVALTREQIMTEPKHLAQLNIGRLRYPTDDPRMAGFMNNLDFVNAIAERTPGFVWRLKDESNNATAIRPFADPDMAVNLSVWESIEALERFVWQTVHKRF